MVLPKEYEWLDLSDPNFNSALTLILTSSQNLNIIGCAGSGKSTLLKLASKLLKGSTIVLSTTGISSANLSSNNIKGSTLHSFFKLPPLSIFSHSIIKHDPIQEQIMCNIDTLLIDEVSMAPATLIDIIIEILRFYRTPHGLSLPRIILFSDILQLPCIVDSKDPNIKKYYDTVYDGKYFFFNSNFYQDSGNFKTIHLNHIFRQKDTSFQNILNRIRQGTFTDQDLSIINSRVISEEEYFINNEMFIYLASTNKLVDEINSAYLYTYDGPSHKYYGVTTGKFDFKKYPFLSEMVEIKKEMQVMCLKNNTIKGYQNGTIGKVLDFSYQDVIITTNKGICAVEREKWEQFEYLYDDVTKKITTSPIGSFSQIGLKPALALTIHKSQGLEFENIFINLSFVTEGLTYVALSRAKTLEGIGLDHPITRQDIKVSKEALEFLSKEV